MDKVLSIYFFVMEIKKIRPMKTLFVSGDISGEEEVETMTVVTGVIRHRLCEKCCSVLRRLYSSCGTATKVAQMFCSVRCFLFFFFTLLSLTHRRQVCVCVYTVLFVYRRWYKPNTVDTSMRNYGHKVQTHTRLLNHHYHYSRVDG